MLLSLIGRSDACSAIRSLGLEVLLETCDAHLAADAGLLVAAERHVGGEPDTTVDAERAGTDPRGDARRRSGRRR